MTHTPSTMAIFVISWRERLRFPLFDVMVTSRNGSYASFRNHWPRACIMLLRNLIFRGPFPMELHCVIADSTPCPHSHNLPSLWPVRAVLPVTGCVDGAAGVEVGWSHACCFGWVSSVSPSPMCAPQVFTPGHRPQNHIHMSPPLLLRENWLTCEM